MSRFMYNDLPSIHSAVRSVNLVEADYLSILGQLLVKYGVHTHLGIGLVHRHFRLEDHEQLTRIRLPPCNDVQVLSTVFNNGIPDPEILKNYNISLSPSSKLVPSMFMVRESGIVPYEFYCMEEEEADSLYFNVLSRIDEEFISEWVAALEDLQVVDVLGLAILNRSQTVLVEEISTDNRVSVYRHCTDGDGIQFIPTIWTAAGMVMEACDDDENHGTPDVSD